MRKVLFWGTFKIMNALIEKSIFLFLLFLLFNVNSFSQSTYSKQNLEQASLEELNTYLKESEKLKKTGTVLSTAGPVTLLAGFALFAGSLEKNEDSLLKYNYTTFSTIGGYVVLAGLVTTIIGVPMLITGSSRVKKITNLMDAKTVSCEFVPCIFQKIPAHHTPPGITFRLKF